MSSTDCSALTLLAENLALVTQQLIAGESNRAHSPDFNLDAFWDRIVAVAKTLSAETTKLCLGFTAAPLPGHAEQSHFSERLQSAVLALVSAFYALPKSQGLTLRKSTRMGVYHAISSLQTLITHMTRVASSSAGEPLSDLTTTGEFWANCEALEALPRTNAAAVAEAIAKERAMVVDAHGEIEEAVKADAESLDNQSADAALAARVEQRLRIIESGDNDDDDEDRWSASDREIAVAATALVKTAAFVLKKMSSALKKLELGSEADVLALDDLAELASRLSPSVDDLVLCLYPPMRREDVGREVRQLHLELRTALEKCKDVGLCPESETRNWVAFLSEAADHNKKKTVDALTGGRS